MTRAPANSLSRKYSLKYSTFWYVREVSPGVFEPYAHSSDDARTVATYCCGKFWAPVLLNKESSPC